MATLSAIEVWPVNGPSLIKFGACLYVCMRILAHAQCDNLMQGSKRNEETVFSNVISKVTSQTQSRNYAGKPNLQPNFPNIFSK